MSKKANPTLIGLFIIVGLVLGVGAIFLFGSSQFFSRTRNYILYFDSSLQGLDPGTPVKFRGVTIGRVAEVLIHFNQGPADSTLPVIIEINEALLDKRSEQTFRLTDAAQFDNYIRRGLRGHLEIQSILTGLLYVDLDFLPATPPKFHQLKPVYTEIPTAPTDIQKLLASLYRVDLGGISEKLTSILAKLDTTLGEIQMNEINSGLTNLLLSLNAVARSPELTNTLISARETLEEFRLLSSKLRYRVDGLSDSLNETLTQSGQALSELRKGVEDLRDVLSPQSALRHDLDTALDQVGEASRSVEGLADFLKRHPNALISGRKPAKP